MKHINGFLRATGGKSDQNGFSLLELIIVMAFIMVAAGLSLFYFSSHRQMYMPDEEGLKLVDLLQEARQRSLTQRQSLRVEIDLTDNMARLINENSPSTVADDRLIRQETLASSENIKFDSMPADISRLPDDDQPAPIAQFKQSVYPSSITHRVCTLRFLPDGKVVDAGTNGAGANSNTTSATLFVWSPKEDNPANANIARAITVSGTSGLIKFWEYNRALTQPNKWQDTRRTGVFGGQTQSSGEE